MTELRPCPWCRCALSIQIGIYGILGEPDYYQLVHPDNDCILSDWASYYTTDKEGLIEDWNAGAKE